LAPRAATATMGPLVIGRSVVGDSESFVTAATAGASGVGVGVVVAGGVVVVKVRSALVLVPRAFVTRSA
jgi:hypothetical protein